ncbi:metal-dependent hydrolase [Amnimonas aquatica]|uniref:Metal-dependent hydrolase n=1 Tax=Amnimonas aquatica TaxID=2094561 RepID=A0A2P6AS45_9GAMM|nr:metal-dependent hydrolase [Amnimonas aquatica]PQA39706.1 metal-dependent hydrolase [Amnimonas aquatica]
MSSLFKPTTEAEHQVPGHSASRTRGRLIPRKVKFDWAKTPLEWIPGRPFASHFINEINMILPAGEFWFCRLYNKALPLVKDEKLRDDMQMFIRQEAMHARAHGGAIAEYLQAHGIDTERNTRIMDWLFEELLADEPFGRKVPKLLERRWLVFRLGIIAAVEHMTCVLGNYALDNKKWDDAGADPVLLDLLRWHGAEEVEHRNVAFDLYANLGGSYLSRYYLASIAVPLVIGLWADGAAHLLNQDPRYAGEKFSVWKPKLWLRWAKESRSGHLPHPLQLAAWQLPFFSPWYDPEKEGSTERALAYLASSPAAAAAQASGQSALKLVK